MRNLAQVPFPPTTISEADDLTLTARATAEEFRQASSLKSFIASKQKITLGALLEAVTHLSPPPLPVLHRGGHTY